MDANASKSDEIVVTGVRASIQRSVDIKRAAPTVVEAITAEDIGKFTDPSIADALQRVPGVQLERNDTQKGGDRISIRGLGPQYVVTTLNGRQALSYGGQYGQDERQFNFDSIPSEILSSVLVYKTSSAELIEPGIAGEVDLRTLRPLDYKYKRDHNFFGGLGGEVGYNDLADRYSPKGYAYAGGKFLDGRLGVFGSVLIADQRTRTDALERNLDLRTINVANVAGSTTNFTPTQVYASDRFLADSLNVEAKRYAYTGAIQFRPNEHWNINADVEFIKYKTSRNNYAIEIPFGTYLNNGAIIQPDGYRSINAGSRQVLTFLDESKVLFPTGAHPDTGVTVGTANEEYEDQNVNQLNGGVNVEWKNDDWTLSVDYGHSDVFLQGFNGYGAFFTGTSRYLPRGDVIDLTNAQSPRVTLGGLPFQDTSYAAFPPSYQGKAFWQNNEDLNAGRIDVQRRAQLGATSLALKLGGRYGESRIDHRQAEYFDAYADFNGFGTPSPCCNAIGTNYPSTLAALEAYGNALRTPSSNVTIFQNQGVISNYNGLTIPAINLRGACDFLGGNVCGAARSAFNQPLFTGPYPQGSSPTDLIPFKPSSDGGSYLIKEENLAVYGQVDARGTIFSLPYDANVGLRWVRIKEKTTGFQGVVRLPDRVVPTAGPSNYTAITASNSYSRFLPSATVNLHPNRNLTVRLGISRTMALPAYESLAPNSVVTIYGPGTFYRPELGNDFSGGNPNLKPTMSTNYDVTFEYYTPQKGAFVVSLFRKEAEDFVYRVATSGTVVGQGTAVFNRLSPVNIANGTANGAEIGFNQPLTFLPAPFDGFGAQANYTYVDSKFSNLGAFSQLDRENNGLNGGFPGSSKHNVNAIIYYEKKLFSVRAAYTYRSSYLSVQPGAATRLDRFPAFTNPEENLDISGTLNPTPWMEFVATATNVTGFNRTDYTFQPGVFRALYVRPRTYTVGVRLRY